MADRPRPQPKKRTAKAAGEPGIAAMTTQRKADVPAPAANTSTPSPAARISLLEAERDRLAAELAAAKAQIATLEAARDQVLNRIDWVIDSLHTLSQHSGDSGC